MRITLADQNLGGKTISWHRGVKMPRIVPLARDGTGKHQDLRRDFWNVDSWAFKNKVGNAYRIRHWGGKTVYWTWRKPVGMWSADARRRLGKLHPELQLVCFADVPYPGIGFL